MKTTSTLLFSNNIKEQTLGEVIASTRLHGGIVRFVIVNQTLTQGKQYYYIRVYGWRLYDHNPFARSIYDGLSYIHNQNKNPATISG